MLFGFDAAAGYSGLLTGKKAVLVLTSAVYGEGRPRTPSASTSSGPTSSGGWTGPESRTYDDRVSAQSRP